MSETDKTQRHHLGRPIGAAPDNLARNPHNDELEGETAAWSCEAQEIYPLSEFADDTAFFELRDDVADFPVFSTKYEVCGKIGMGGTGVVYLGIEKATSQWVALKTMKPAALVTSNSTKQLRDEAKVLQKLTHPNIIGLLETFEHLDRPVLVLEYAYAGTLQRALEHCGTLRPEVAALVTEQIASAVAYIHDQQLLHRDITPNNVLLDLPNADELTFDDMRQLAAKLGREMRAGTYDWNPLVPKLSDFGFVISFGTTEQLSQSSGSIVGTPSYMAPESISPQIGRISIQTDIYGIGSVLYRCLTGKAPHVGSNFLEITHQVLGDDVVPPRLLAKNISPELNEICMKCLAKNPGNRYATTADLHSDLVRLRSKQKLRFARPPGTVRKAFRWAKNNRVAAISMLLIFFVGLLGTLLVHHWNSRIIRQNFISNLETVAREQSVVLNTQISAQLELVKAVGEFVSREAEFSPKELERFCTPLLQSHQTIKALSWATVVPDEKRQTFQESAAFSGGSQQSIREKTNTGELVPASDRLHYFPVQGIVPLEGNYEALGFDLGSEPKRLGALRKAMKTRDLVITSPVRLVQDDLPINAFLAIFPVWDSARRSASSGVFHPESTNSDLAGGPAQTLHLPIGFATGVFHFNDVIEPCLGATRQKLWLRIVDVTEEPILVFESAELKGNLPESNPLPLSPSATSFDQFGRSWRIEYFLPKYSQRGNESSGMLVVIIGLLLSALLGGIPFIVNLFNRY